MGLRLGLCYSSRMHEFIRAILSGLIPLLILMVESRAAEVLSSSVFTFKTPRSVTYQVEPLVEGEWISACEVDRPDVRVQFGAQILLRLSKGYDLEQVQEGFSLDLVQEFASNFFILNTRSIEHALMSAHIIANRDGVELSHPVRRQSMDKKSILARFPNDPLYPLQWTLENRDAETSAIIGPDFNIREAWASATGKGIIIGIVDDGIDLTHTELHSQGVEKFHYNFTTMQPEGESENILQSHGTIVSGIAVAKLNNKKGIAGVSPDAKFASHIVWDIDDNFGNEIQVANMFRFRNNDIQIQNHSWGSSSIEQLDVPEIQLEAINSAIENGRNGKGVLMIRVAGNERSSDWSAHDDGYSNDPRVVTVGAVGYDGKVAGFSNVGACVLCSGLVGQDSKNNPVYSTDRMGEYGWNDISSADDPEVGSYYAIERGGNSFSAPQIAGLVALILEANSDLTYRDVQQVLLHSSRHYNFSDPFLKPNAAGYRFSINTGFGVPDASIAVRLAKSWVNADRLVVKSYKKTSMEKVPDDGLIVQAVLDGEIINFKASPGDGLVMDEGSNPVPVVDVGKALDPINVDLDGKAAFIQRGGAYFSKKVGYAADAGAVLALIYNNNGGEERLIMGDLKSLPIPAVFLSQNDGAKINSMMAKSTVDPLFVKLKLDHVSTKIDVPDSLICEQVGIRVDMSHPIRGDIRLTVKSPSGTRCILQANVPDGSPWRSDWFFWTNQFFFESANGEWEVDVSDLAKSYIGVLDHVELTIRGTKIFDSDNDGLSDEWEISNFNSLDETSLSDVDNDGYPNSFEQAMHSDPSKFDRYLSVRLHSLTGGRLRFSWPIWSGFEYQFQISENVNGPWSNVSNVAVGEYEGEWIGEVEEGGYKFFRLKTEINP